MSPQEDPFDEWLPVARCQRRIIHQVSQLIDEGLLRDSALSDRIRLENAAGETNVKLRSLQVKQELLRRFLARNSGFVATQTGGNADLIDTKQMMKVRAKNRLGVFAFPSIAVYHDASDVCSKEVARL